MIGSLARKIFGSRNDRTIKRLRKQVAAANEFESAVQSLDDAALASQTEKFKLRLAKGESLDAVLPEAFATVREAGQRVLGMRHYDEQFIGALVLHEGRISEMRTGEGKTLVATLAVYLNALAGQGVHVITVNDYLARRDSAWMGRLYHFLGLSTGVINGSGAAGPNSSSYLVDPDYDGNGDESGTAGLRPCTRREAYAADITYGTNNEFGFDYLRDNMVMALDDRVQRGQYFAIVDEVDSILIDEARTPLIISGPAADTSELYQRINALIPNLQAAADPDSEGDFTVDEKAKQVHFTETGHDQVEALLVEAGILEENDSLYNASNIAILHHLNAALRAHAIFRKDVEYIVSNGQIVIVDEFTGRTMPGRRWSDGLHQAIEAKEQVPIQNENQTLASITFQNYFRQYDKLSGMTGTADTEAYEFQQIYNLEVVVVPTHRPMVRDDRADLVYLTQDEKFAAIVDDIVGCVERQQPVLVGTTSIETSEQLSQVLKNKKIAHEVLNAKQHEREASIIANAGRSAAVTIATNMAGRGTDIVLGGNLEGELAGLDESEKAEARAQWQLRHDAVLAAGGLHIIGTERHESRRIDNQLRGRSGRQGDSGSSRFYLSLEDSLMRIFASERVSGLMQKLGMEDGEAIEHPWVSRAIENAQRKVEAHNFDIRKHLLEYDDVANAQRGVVYAQRDEVMSAGEDLSSIIESIREDVLSSVLAQYMPPGSVEEQWNIPALEQDLEALFGLTLPVQQWLNENKRLDDVGVLERILELSAAAYAEKREKVGDETLHKFEQFALLTRLDEHWKEHLGAMDYLRQSVGLRGYAQKNPKQEYKRESFEMFSAMLEEYRKDVIGLLGRLQIRDPEPPPPPPAPSSVNYTHETAESALQEEPAQSEAPAAAPYVRPDEKIGRNDACPCGSGKKYKHCHGRI